MYIYIYIYIHLYIYIIYTYLYIYIYISTHTHIYIYIFKYTHAYKQPARRRRWSHAFRQRHLEAMKSSTSVPCRAILLTFAKIMCQGISGGSIVSLLLHLLHVFFFSPIETRHCAQERRFFWALGPRPSDFPGLTELEKQFGCL